MPQSTKLDPNAIKTNPEILLSWWFSQVMAGFKSKSFAQERWFLKTEIQRLVNFDTHISNQLSNFWENSVSLSCPTHYFSSSSFK